MAIAVGGEVIHRRRGRSTTAAYRSISPGGLTSSSREPPRRLVDQPACLDVRVFWQEAEMELFSADTAVKCPAGRNTALVTVCARIARGPGLIDTSLPWLVQRRAGNHDG